MLYTVSKERKRFSPKRRYDHVEKRKQGLVCTVLVVNAWPAGSIRSFCHTVSSSFPRLRYSSNYRRSASLCIWATSNEGDNLL